MLPSISDGVIAIGMIECCAKCRPKFGQYGLQGHRTIHAVFHADHCPICEIWWTTTPEWPLYGPCPRCGRNSDQRTLDLNHAVAVERWGEAT